MSRLFRQDQDQDFYFKTKTICHVLEAPRDQDQGLETTSLLFVVISGNVSASVGRDKQVGAVGWSVSQAAESS